MPKGAPARIEKLAYEIVRDEEVSRGWQPGPQLSQRQQPIEGCDFFSAPPGGGDSHPIEVKGWGEPLRTSSGEFTYPADIRVQQLERARRDPNWRLEIVANLTAVVAGAGQPERLTLTAENVVARARPWMFKVPLDDSREQVASEAFDLVSSTGAPIDPIEQWRGCLNDREREKFKPGYSAYETARAWAGLSVPTEIALVFAQPPLADYKLRRVVVEATTPFDAYGEPRHHDLLATLRNAAGREAVVGIESKVNEDLGASLTKELERANNRVARDNEKAIAAGRPARHTTNMPARLHGLSTALLDRDHLPADVPFAAEDKDLAYQLLTALAGTLVEAARPEVDVAVLLVHEFHTSISQPDVEERSSGRIRELLGRLKPPPGKNQLLGKKFPTGQLLGPYRVLGGGKIPGDKDFYVAKVRTVVGAV